jgi:hypothetical protein
MGLFRLAAKLAVLGVGVHYGVDQYRYAQDIAKTSRQALVGGMRSRNVCAITYESVYPRCPWMTRQVMARVLEVNVADSQPERGADGDTVLDRKTGITLSFQPAHSRVVCQGVFWREPATIVASR